MTNLALRRQVAEARGWDDLAIVPIGASMKTVTGRPDAESGTGMATPHWDCDLNAAGDLWAELVAAGLLVIIRQDISAIQAQAGPTDDDGNGINIFVDCAEGSDPRENACVAICRLWLEWKKGAKA